MGQYFKIVFLSDDGKFIRSFICPRTYGNGSKLMEQAWMDAKVMKVVELMLSTDGMFYKSRIVWAGDYAEPESVAGVSAPEDDEYDGERNLYAMTNACQLKKYKQEFAQLDTTNLRYIVNHTKRLYVDKLKEAELNPAQFHPLPLLTYEGSNAYEGSDEHLGGTWARDIISMDSEIPAGYEELTCNFKL